MLGEIHRVQAADVDLAEKLLKVRGRSSRVIPITDDIVALLKRRRDRTEGQLFEPWLNVRRDLSRASSSAALSATTPSDLRRAFIGWLASSGVPQAVTLGLVGRGSSRVVQGIYGQPDLDAIRAALSKLPLLEPEDGDANQE